MMIILRFWWEYSTRQSFGSIHQHNDMFGGSCHSWQQPMFGENPVASMWLPIGTCLIVLQDFLEVATEQSLTRFTKHAKVVFPTASDRKDLQPAKKNSEQLRKKAGFLGSLGRFGVSKHRACGFDMPTCTEWCLRGLQRRTLEARSCNYKPCWFIYLRVHYLRLLVTDM